jgi:signal transduction histidine kinase
MQEAEVAKQSDHRTGRPRVGNRRENAGEFPHSAVPGSLDEKQVERVLATARALLAGALVAAITFASDRSPYGQYYWLIISGYCVYCMGLIVLYRIQPVVWRNGRMAVHVADLIWAGVMMMIFSINPYAPFIVFLIFPLLAAAMRWGFRATMITAISTVVMLFLITWMVNLTVANGTQAVPYGNDNTVPIGSASLLILGFLLGYLGEHEKQLRSEAIAVARVATQAHQTATPNDTIGAVFEELFGMFEPAQIQLALHEVPTGRLHLWELNRDHRNEIRRPVCRELDFSYREQFLFEDNDHYLLGHRSNKPHGGAEVQIFNHLGKAIKDNPYDLGDDWFPRQMSSFICVPLVFGGEWEVRIFLWDPPLSKLNRKTVRAAAEMAERLAPMIFGAALQQHLSSRATAEERSRFVRELHDGIMQSLVGLDMKTEVILKRLEGRQSDPVYKDIVSVQQVLRGEVSNLRELIQHNRRIEIGPTRLLTYLSETVSRFQREIGITSRFICELDEVNLPASTCYEVARIVQEALTNVHKHSGARSVIVRLAEHGDKWVLVISDDGRGFDFVGRHTLSELDAARKGPVVLKERVRSIAGDLVIESVPERGVRLEVTFAKEG